MCLVTERCEKCKYKGEVMFWEPCCDYILIAGKSSGCPAGDECDKDFKTKMKKEMLKANQYNHKIGLWDDYCEWKKENNNT